ncbi:MAG: initiation control protein YabA [Syntrophomonadaceae bacterium]|nr:initiation control protein YabA [Syntrophomonadaceae bacterium]HPR93245.1 initiation control protein YabA [Syntrophomonadaceae bacterium]
MEKTVQDLKMIIRELTIEIGDLKQRVRDLEKEKTQKEDSQPRGNSTILLRAEGYENLGSIYKEGFHICPVAYGQPREGECLFCIAFMSRE